MRKLLHCILDFLGLTGLLPNLHLFIVDNMKLPDKNCKYLVLVLNSMEDKKVMFCCRFG
jgi:hypothetical protein